MEEDTGMSQEKREEEEPQRGLDLKEAFGIVTILDSTINWADKGQRKGEGEGREKRKKEDRVYTDPIWNFGRKLDKVVRGEMLAWGVAHQKAERQGCAEFSRGVQRRWEVWRNRLSDRKELATDRLANELGAIRKQLAVVMSELKVALPGQEKLAEK